jgi:hypothetical protein
MSKLGKPGKHAGKEAENSWAEPRTEKSEKKKKTSEGSQVP